MLADYEVHAIEVYRARALSVRINWVKECIAINVRARAKYHLSINLISLNLSGCDPMNHRYAYKHEIEADVCGEWRATNFKLSHIYKQNSYANNAFVAQQTRTLTDSFAIKFEIDFFQILFFSYAILQQMIGNRVWCRQWATVAAAAMTSLRPSPFTYHSVLYFIFNWMAIKLTRCCVQTRSPCSRWARNERCRVIRKTRNQPYIQFWFRLSLAQECHSKACLQQKYEKTVPGVESWVLR